jgi:hypothetical protein
LTILPSPFSILNFAFSLLNSPLSARRVRRRAPVVGGARNAMNALDLRRVRRFFARFKKSSRFQRSNRRNAGCHRTAGYQPAMSAERGHLASKNPVATAPGSDLANAAAGDQQRTTNNKPRTTNRERAVRRQLFDDSIRGRSGVMDIFPVWHGFPETTRFSRYCVVFS